MERGYLEILSAFGCPSALFFDSSAAGQRESYRRWYSATVEPLAIMLAAGAERQVGNPDRNFTCWKALRRSGRPGEGLPIDDLGRDGPCQGGGIGRADDPRGLTDG